MSASDEHHMAQALQLARRGLGLTWPNPSVGTVVVSPEGDIVARGWTAPGGRPHAEAIALERAGSEAAGATIYVTLEPCAHSNGRGPACADLIAKGRILRLGRSLAVGEATVWSEGTEWPVAHCVGTYAIPSGNGTPPA